MKKSKNIEADGKCLKRSLSSIEQKCDIHNRTADDTNVLLPSKSGQWNSVDVFKPQRTTYQEDEKENNEKSTVTEDFDTVTVTTTTTTTAASMSATDVALSNKQNSHARGK